MTLDVEMVTVEESGATRRYFTIEETAEDLVPPTLDSSVPADAATGVLATANVVLTFDKALDVQSAIDDANFVLLKTSDMSVVAKAITIDATHKIVTLNPSASLTAGAAYQWHVTKGVKSATGVALGAVETGTFTIAA